MAWPYIHYHAYYEVLVNKKVLNIDLRLNYLKMCDQKASRSRFPWSYTIIQQTNKYINTNIDAEFHDWVLYYTYIVARR